MNILWPPLFFGLHWLLTSFVEIVLLDVFILINIILFCQISLVAGLILIPYLLWVSFASYLSGGIWYLNKETELEISKEYVRNTA